MEVRPGYKQTEVGVIPVQWHLMPFRRAVGAYIDYRGRTPKKLGMDWGGGDILALSANNVQMGGIDTEKEAYFGSDALYARWMTQGDCERGDVLLTMEAPLGNIAQIPDCKKYILSQRVLLIKPKAWLERDYLAHYMRGRYFQCQLNSHSTGSTAKGIQRAKLDQIPICVPQTQDEQRAIAAALSDVDALLAKLDQLIAKKRDLKQAAMQQLLTGQTRLPGFSGEWELKRLGELGDFLKGRGVSRDQSQTGSLACVRYGEIYTTHDDYIREFQSWISAEVARTATRLKTGDILFAGSGETKEEIGKCVAFVDGREAYAGGDIVILRPQKVDSLFLGYALNTPTVNRQKASRGQGDAVVHISANALADVSVSMPELSEQTAIAAVLSDMDAEVAALEARRDKTRLLKQGMMQELLTGRTRLV